MITIQVEIWYLYKGWIGLLFVTYTFWSVKIFEMLYVA